MDSTLRLIKYTLIVCTVLLLLYFLFVYKKNKNKAPLRPPPVVVVKKPICAEVADYITETGNTVAYNTVKLVARVEGYLNKISFIDGTFVKKDQELFVIEPQPYIEKLKEAEALVLAQQANLEYAQTEYTRRQTMYKDRATSLTSVEKWQAKRDEAQAAVAKAKANAVNAAITNSYTHISAPFDGRIGRHLVDSGNLVGNGKATDLATIEQLDPIYVYFNMNELDFIKIRTAARAQGFKASDVFQVPVQIGLQNETTFPHKGHLDFINTGLNTSTGTMEFRALLDNKKHTLVPGLFVKVRIAVSAIKPRLMVPDAALQTDQVGPYLLVVNHDSHVVRKRVKLGGLENEMRIILKGIKTEDDVIILGLQFATPGNPVTPKKSS